MSIIFSLRFRLSLYFGIFLTTIATLVLSFLLDKIKEEFIEKIDSQIQENMDAYTEVFYHCLYDNEDKAEVKLQGFRELEKEVFDLLRQGYLKDESYIFISPSGKVLFNKTFSDDLSQTSADSLIESYKSSEIYNINLDFINYPVRVFSVEVSQGYKLVIAVSLEEFANQISDLQLDFITAALFIIFTGCAIAWITISKSMQGVRLVTEAADDFAGGNLDRKVDWKGQGTEIKVLIDHFNHMTSQIHKLVSGMQDVTNNVAHDLRTPVTRMRSLAENILQEDPENKLAAHVIEESERQSAIIEDVLSLAESEAGILQLNLSSVNLNELIKDLAEIYNPSVKDKKCSIKLLLPESHVVTKLDKGRIQRVIANLLDNAIKFCNEAKILIELKHSEKFIRVRIKDNGPGISDDDKFKIFDRFYRGDKSRNSQGSGLGLSLAKAYIESHKGSLEVEDSSEGASFLIILPKV